MKMCENSTVILYIHNTVSAQQGKERKKEIVVWIRDFYRVYIYHVLNSLLTKHIFGIANTI